MNHDLYGIWKLFLLKMVSFNYNLTNDYENIFGHAVTATNYHTGGSEWCRWGNTGQAQLV